MTNTVNKIINAADLKELLDEINEFCKESYMRDDDTDCMRLIEMVKNKENSDIHMLLASYLSICEDGDEVIEALYEFVSNCSGFVETDEEMTQQITKDEFETVLSECEEKIGIVSCIEKDHELRVAEIPMMNKYREFGMKFKGNDIVLVLPKIDINTDTKQYIAEELGAILYDVLKTKIEPETLLHELNRYIPETRTAKESARELFRKYFYSVVLYKERKPGIYPKFDSHMKQVLDMEFFKRIIKEYIRCSRNFVRAYSEMQFNELDFDSSAYMFNETEGIFTGTIACKKWGRKQNILVFVDFDDGRKIICTAFWKDKNEYLGIHNIEIGKKVSLEFKRSKNGIMRLVDVKKIK